MGPNYVGENVYLPTDCKYKNVMSKFIPCHNTLDGNDVPAFLRFARVFFKMVRPYGGNVEVGLQQNVRQLK